MEEREGKSIGIFAAAIPIYTIVVVVVSLGLSLTEVLYCENKISAYIKNEHSSKQF